MAEPDADVALLTPVPEEHLASGLAVCAEQGKVAYGTDAVMALPAFNALVGKDSVADVLFYASHTANSKAPAATYRARFVEHVGALANGKAPPSCSMFRPPTTESDGPWLSFYIVRNLQKLAEPIPIKKLSKHNAKGKFKPDFVPRGPIIIDTPF